MVFLQNYKRLNGRFDFLSLGLSSYGAVVGALLFLALFSFQFRKPLNEMLYIFTPSIPLMYAIGKVGCFLAGCCYGVEYGGFGYVVYNYSQAAPANVRLFPVQIVETACFFAVFLYMIARHKRKRFNTRTVGVSFVLCGGVKFTLDFLRYNPADGMLSVNQIISIVFVLIGAAVIACAGRKFLLL
jgi:phosphatidylglycerol:prolipoprotein diacylglycerol transferase